MPWSPTTAFKHPLVNVRESNAESGLTNYLTYAFAEMMYAFFALPMFLQTNSRIIGPGKALATSLTSSGRILLGSNPSRSGPVPLP